MLLPPNLTASQAENFLNIENQIVGKTKRKHLLKKILRLTKRNIEWKVRAHGIYTRVVDVSEIDERVRYKNKFMLTFFWISTP